MQIRGIDPLHQILRNGRLDLCEKDPLINLPLTLNPGYAGNNSRLRLASDVCTKPGIWQRIPHMLRNLDIYSDIALHPRESKTCQSFIAILLE